MTAAEQQAQPDNELSQENVQPSAPTIDKQPEQAEEKATGEQQENKSIPVESRTEEEVKGVELEQIHGNERQEEIIKEAPIGGDDEKMNHPELMDERKFSVVSFREVCELYEIDLEKGERDRQVIESRPSALKSVRHYVMLLALISPFVTTYSRTIINFAITDMIDPRYIIKQADTGLALTDLTPNATRLLYFDTDNSCPVDYETRLALIEQNSKDTERARTTSGEKFEWDEFKQGLLKGAYSFGHAFFQIPGSRLSEIYGSHLVISMNAILIGVCCLAAPFLASLHFYLILVDLVVLGILGSFMTPAAITLFSNWLTPGEKSLMMSFMLVGSRLGYALSSFLCGQLLEADISWRYVFYSSGFTGLSFGILFFVLLRSRPKDHPLVSQLELDYLATKNTLVRESLEEDSLERTLEMRQVKVKPDGEGIDEKREKTGRVEKKTSAPWLALATSAPIWAFVITKFCVKFAGDTVQTELPTYLKKVMHYSAADNGKVNTWNYVIFCLGCIGIGTLAKRLVKERPFGLSKTSIRKLFQCVSSFGVSLVLMAIGFSICDKLSTELLLVTFFLITTFGMGGEAQNPLDLSDRYSGTIHAIGSSLSISGAIEPYLVGIFLQGRGADKDRWRYVWFCASAISFIGGLVFVLFAEAEVQPFDEIGSESHSAGEFSEDPVGLSEDEGDEEEEEQEQNEEKEHEDKTKQENQEKVTKSADIDSNEKSRLSVEESARESETKLKET